MNEEQRQSDTPETAPIAQDDPIEETPAAESSETAGTGTEEPSPATSGSRPKSADKKKIKKLEAELEALKGQLAAAETATAEEHDKYLRLYAEYDNFRRRTAKEKESIYGDATAASVQSILPVIDTLERAAAGLSSEEAESPLGKGILMTLKSATDALAKLGVEVVEAETFDPDIHNAVMHVEDESLPEGAVVEVFQKGYRKGDRIIRYAMVKVAN